MNKINKKNERIWAHIPRDSEWAPNLVEFPYDNGVFNISSAESQKNAIANQRCSIQKTRRTLLPLT